MPGGENPAVTGGCGITVVEAGAKSPLASGSGAAGAAGRRRRRRGGERLVEALDLALGAQRQHDVGLGLAGDVLAICSLTSS